MIQVLADSPSLLVGLTGGIATGKSVVADMLEELGARAIDFDVLARRVVAPGEPAWRDIVDHFGPGVLDQDRSIDRRRLGEIVFADASERAVLERLTHPRIREEFGREVRTITDRDPGSIIVAVVPLLVEGGLESHFDHVVVVFAPDEVQLDRLMRRDGLSRDAAGERLAAQLPIEKKLSSADTVIDNSDSLDNTRHQVEELWERLCLLREKKRGGRIRDGATSP
jgi:dephospho-CoA kinase